MPTFEEVFYDALNNLKNSIKSTPLNLGGISYSGGGAGSPPGGYVGQLPQTRVAYDYTEESTLYTPSGVSLLDNLNHIRYQIAVLSGGGDPSFTVLDDGVLIASGITNLNFEGDFVITPYGNGATIAISGQQGEPGTPGATDLSILEDSVLVASGIKNINFEGNVSVSTNGIDTVTVVMSGGGTSNLSLPFTEDVGIYVEPSGALHVKASGVDQVPIIIQGTGSTSNSSLGTIWVRAREDGINFAEYSTNGIDWTEITSNIVDTSSYYVFDIAFNDSMCIIVGNFSGSIATSTDGINFTTVPSDPFPDGQCDCIAWNGTMWLAGGYGYFNPDEWYLSSSTDGINWTPVPQTILDHTINDIAWNGTMWIAVGDGYTAPYNTIMYSYNGIDWTGLGDDTFTSYGTCVAWGNNVWVAGSTNSSKIAYSSNGINWYDSDLLDFDVNNITWNGTKFLAVGKVYGTPTDNVYESTNGINWTSLGSSVFLGNATTECVAWNGSMWYIGGFDGVGTSPRMVDAYSTDGITWTNIDVFDNYNYSTCVACSKAPALVPPLNAESTVSYQVANLAEWRDYEYNLLGYIDSLGTPHFNGIIVSGITISGVVEEAPNTGEQYVREDSSWELLTKLTNRVIVGTNGNFSTLKEATDWFNTYATSNTEILLDAGHHEVANTITVHNDTYNLQIRGLGSAITYVDATASLNNNPMFLLESHCDINKITCEGENATGNCDGIVFNGSSLHYAELTDLFINNFRYGVSDTVGTEIFMFNFAINNCSEGIRVNYSSDPGEVTTLDIETGNITYCPIGINLLHNCHGTRKTNFFINNIVFKHSNTTDIGIKYTQTDFYYGEIANIFSCTYNDTGKLLSGFDWTSSTDSNIEVLSNIGEENKNPHAKINVLNSSETTTITTAGVYYKAGFTNDFTYTCKVSITDNKMLYMSKNIRDGLMWITANLSSNKAAAANNEVCVRKNVQNISSVIGNGTTVTVTTTTEHHLDSGLNIQMLGWSNSAHNGVKTITVTSPTTFTYLSGTSATSTGGTCGALLSQMTVRTQGSGVVVPFSMITYIDGVSLNDYFEIYITAPNNGDVITIHDLHWLFDTR